MTSDAPSDLPKATRSVHDLPTLEFGGGIDADGHVLEPPDLWDTYLEPRFRDRSITIREGADGIEELVVDNAVLMQGRLAALGGVEHRPEEIFLSPDIRYLDGCPEASYDTAARVALLDD